MSVDFSTANPEMNTFTFLTTDPRLLEAGCLIKSPVKLTSGEMYHFKGLAKVVGPDRFSFGEWQVRGQVEDEEVPIPVK
jgi:hypothetical protein